MEFVAAIFSGLWQAILSKFGMSSDQKLGRDEVIISEQKAIIEGIKNAQKIDADNTKLSDAELLQRTQQFQRPGK